MEQADNIPPIHKQRLQRRRRPAPLWRAVIEIGFIMFLFYSNLLMGEFTHSNNANNKSLIAAVGDVVTLANFDIDFISALIGYVVVEYLRGKL